MIIPQKIHFGNIETKIPSMLQKISVIHNSGSAYLYIVIRDFVTSGINQTQDRDENCGICLVDASEAHYRSAVVR